MWNLCNSELHATNTPIYTYAHTDRNMFPVYKYVPLLQKKTFKIQTKISCFNLKNIQPFRTLYWWMSKGHDTSPITL